MRECERETERQRDRETERQRDRETERQRERERAETETETSTEPSALNPYPATLNPRKPKTLKPNAL